MMSWTPVILRNIYLCDYFVAGFNTDICIPEQTSPHVHCFCAWHKSSHYHPTGCQESSCFHVSLNFHSVPTACSWYDLLSVATLLLYLEHKRTLIQKMNLQKTSCQQHSPFLKLGALLQHWECCYRGKAIGHIKKKKKKGFP